VHLSLFPELGNKVRRAFIEGVHLESVHLERVDCTTFMIVKNVFFVDLYKRV